MPGFGPAGEALLFRQKGPKPLTPRLAQLERTDASLRRADQLAEPVLSRVEGLKQGPPADESVPPLARRQASGSRKWRVVGFENILIEDFYEEGGALLLQCCSQMARASGIHS